MSLLITNPFQPGTLLSIPSKTTTTTPTTVFVAPSYYPPYRQKLPDSYNVNTNEETFDLITKYYRYVTLDKWLPKENKLKYVLKHLVGGSANEPIAVNKNADVSKIPFDSDVNVVNNKIEYIRRNVLKNENMYKILKKYLNSNDKRISWVDLVDKNRDDINTIKKELRDIIGRYLVVKLQNM
jgi:hypothetical protein